MCVNAPTVLMLLSKIQGGWSDRARLKIYKHVSLENCVISRKDAQTNTHGCFSVVGNPPLKFLCSSSH